MSSVGPAVRGDLAEAELDGELVVWNPTTGAVVQLDRLASMIWSELDGSRQIEELVADLAGAFEVDAAIVEADLGDLLARLAEAGFLEEQSRP